MRLLAIFGVGLAAYIGEWLLWGLFHIGSLDPNIGMAEGAGFLLYVAAFTVTAFVVPGLMAPEHTTRKLRRIALGTLVFPAVCFTILAALSGHPTLPELGISLAGIPPGIAVLATSTFWRGSNVPN